MKILTVPNPALTQKAQPVKKIDRKIHRVIAEMKKVLSQSKIGVGLAAPQIGYPLQIFIIAYKSYRTYKKKLVFLNPKITKKSLFPTSNLQSPTSNLEGCLSLPNIWGYVSRAKALRLKYLDEKGKLHEHLFRGFLATIIQHEVDHLQGILFTEHVLSQGEKLYRQIKDKKTGKVVMKEIGI